MSKPDKPLCYNIKELNVDELVVVRIEKITNMGINVILLEYNNRPALINVREISTTRYKSLKTINQ